MGLVPVVAQVQHRIDFEKNYRIDTIIAAGKTYQYIQASGLDYQSRAGKPYLPTKITALLLPAGATATKVSLNIGKAQRMLLTHPFYPGQPPVPTSTLKEDIVFTPPLKEVYESNTPYPQNQVQIISTTDCGDNRIVYLEVSPFQYFPKSNELYFAPALDFTIEYTLPKTPLPKSGMQCSAETLKSLIDNPKDIETYAAKAGYSTMAAQTYGMGLNCDYIIVTPRYLMPAFAELMAWKKQKGVNIKIMPIETIKAYYTGDLISSIYDDAGKLRQFIIDSYKTSGADRIAKPLFILLAGDHTMVPIRYANNGEDMTDPRAIVPTDSYFGDITYNWDVDRDGRYGEWSDNVYPRILYAHVGSITIKAAEFAPGTYTYMLHANGKELDAKRMILTK